MQARYRPVYWNSFQVPDSLIQSRLDNLAARSPAFAKALNHIRETRFFTLIASAEQADLILGLECLIGSIAKGVLSETGYMAGSADGDVVGAFVRIDVDAIRTIARRRHTAITSANATVRDAVAAPGDGVRTRTVIDSVMAGVIDEVLIHEVWGHVVPVAERRHDSGRCPDPEPDDHPMASCVIQRENWLRVQLGLPPTAHYGIIDGDIPPSQEPLARPDPIPQAAPLHVRPSCCQPAPCCKPSGSTLLQTIRLDPAAGPAALTTSGPSIPDPGP